MDTNSKLPGVYCSRTDRPWYPSHGLLSCCKDSRPLPFLRVAPVLTWSHPVNSSFALVSSSARVTKLCREQMTSIICPSDPRRHGQHLSPIVWESSVSPGVSPKPQVQGSSIEPRPCFFLRARRPQGTGPEPTAHKGT